MRNTVIEKGKELQKVRSGELAIVPEKKAVPALKKQSPPPLLARDSTTILQFGTREGASGSDKKSRENDGEKTREEQAFLPDVDDDLDFENPDLDAADIALDDEEDGNEDDEEQKGTFDIIDVASDGNDEEESSLPAVRKNHLPQVQGAHDALSLYMREISKFPLLKPDEEHELAVRVRDHNDPDAAFRLVSSHLRLVVRIAIEFQRRWMQNVLDLIQEGNVGLMRAVNKFDPDKGIKFSYYASFWIKAYILKFIMDNWRMVKIGTTQVQRKLFFNLNKERQKLIAQGFDPDASMLSERLGVSEEQINEMNQRMSFTDMSLNTTINNENDSASRMDFLPALGPGIEDSLASDEIVSIVRLRLKGILPHLNEKEQFILKNRLLTDDPLTLREIGERYKITRERVRQLEARLLEKIKKYFATDIKDFSPSWIQ